MMMTLKVNQLPLFVLQYVLFHRGIGRFFLLFLLQKEEYYLCKQAFLVHKYNDSYL